LLVKDSPELPGQVGEEEFEVFPVKGHEAGTAGVDESLSPTPPPTSFAFSTLAHGFHILSAMGWSHLCQMYRRTGMTMQGTQTMTLKLLQNRFTFFFVKLHQGKVLAAWTTHKQSLLISQWHRDTDIVK